jgi:hypothetical protein
LFNLWGNMSHLQGAISETQMATITLDKTDAQFLLAALSRFESEGWPACDFPRGFCFEGLESRGERIVNDLEKIANMGINILDSVAAIC